MQIQKPAIKSGFFYGSETNIDYKNQLNQSATNIRQSFSVQNRPVTHFTPYITSETLNLQQGVRTNIDASGRFVFTLPAMSVTTLVVE
jgi:O-glycosyl hydrolase